MTGPGFPLLSSRQVTITVTFGVVLWFAAAMLLRTIIPLGALAPGPRVLFYALLIPGTAPFVWLLARAARLGQAQVAPAAALGTGVATLCDGTALAWFPTLYAADADGARLAGAAILWGAGVAITLGFLMARKVGHVRKD